MTVYFELSFRISFEISAQTNFEGKNVSDDFQMNCFWQIHLKLNRHHMTFSSFTPQTSPWCSFTLSLSLPLSLSLCLYLFLVYLFRNLSSLPSFRIVLTIRFFYQPWTILRFLSLPSSFSFCLMHTLSFFSDGVYFLVTSVSAQMKMFILVLFFLYFSLSLY